MCELFDIHKSTLTAWKRLGAEGYIAKNRWDLKLFLTWWATHIYSGPSEPNDNETLSRAKLVYWQAKGEREQLKVKAERAELVPKSIIAAAWASRVGEVTAALTGFVDRLPPLLVGKSREDIRLILSAEFHQLRERYSRNGKYCEGESRLVSGGASGMETARAIIHQPVGGEIPDTG